MDYRLLVHGSANTIYYRQKIRAGNAAIIPGPEIFANLLGGRGLLQASVFSFASANALLKVLEWDSGDGHVFLVNRIGNVQKRFPDNRMWILPTVQLVFSRVTHLRGLTANDP